MFKPPLSQLLLGLVALQIGVMTVVGSPTKSDVFTWNQAVNSAQNRRFVEGSRLPKLAFRGETGAMLDVKFPATLVLRSPCSCDDVAVGNWMKTAKSSGVSGVLVCVGDEMPLSRARRLVDHSQRVAKCRSNDLMPLLAPDQDLPLAVHINAQGTITALEGTGE